MDKGPVYARVTELFAARNFAEGDRVLAAERAKLPPAVFQECLGNRQFYDRNFAGASATYASIHRADPGYDLPRYHYLLGVKFEQLEKYEDAFKSYQAAIELEPTFVDAYVELGGMLTKIEDYAGAERCYADALKLTPDDPAVRYNHLQVLKALAATDPKAYGPRKEQAEAEFARVADRGMPAGAGNQW